jgi:hypothetical protein
MSGKYYKVTGICMSGNYTQKWVIKFYNYWHLTENRSHIFVPELLVK